MTDKPHISSTQMSMLWRCPEQYRRRYIEGEVIPPGVSLIQGRAFHVGAETNFRQKIESHADLPRKEIVEASAAAFDGEVLSGGYMLSEDEVGRGMGVVLGEAKDQLVQLAGLHADEQAPAYQPVAVEHATRIVFPEATHDLLAITDLRDDRARVVDFKTAARKMPADAADKSIQLTVYAAAHRIETGDDPSEVRLDIATKTKKPARQVVSSTRSVADYKALLARVNATLAVIQAGVFGPCAPDSWACSPRWCGYWGTCPYVNSERVARAEGD